MIRVTAWPTVEWLHKRRADRLPIETDRRVLQIEETGRRGPLASTRRDRQHAPLPRLAAILNRQAAPGTVVHTTAWIQTPDGELPVNIVLERFGRRIAINFSDRYESASEAQDALVLVYGGFDALYRVRLVHTEDQAHDIVYALMCDLPSWFTLQGRIKAGRLASALAVVAVHTGNGKRRCLLGGSSLDRIRLCVASDWVNSFEGLLDVAKTRLPRNRA